MSLRDVERAMIVFKYFCDKSDVFNEYVSKMAENEVCLIHLKLKTLFVKSFSRTKNQLTLLQEL